MKKLTKNGFSAVEVVIAVVAVVVVAGLGYFAYSNWSGGSDSENETSQSAETDNDVEALPDKADAAWSYYGGLNISSNRQMLFALCKKRSTTYSAVWAVGPRWGSNRTESRPWVSFYDSNKSRLKTYSGSNLWWQQYVTQSDVTVNSATKYLRWGLAAQGSGSPPNWTSDYYRVNKNVNC